MKLRRNAVDSLRAGARDCVGFSAGRDGGLLAQGLLSEDVRCRTGADLSNLPEGTPRDGYAVCDMRHL